MADAAISEAEFSRLLKEFDELCISEYGKGLRAILEGPQAGARLRRLAGVALKKDFAESTGKPKQSLTNAQRSWHWDRRRLEAPAKDLEQTPQYQFLIELRDELPRLDPQRAVSGLKGWNLMLDVADHESGLFRVAYLYLKDAAQGKGARTFREYWRIQKETSTADHKLLAAGFGTTVSIVTGSLIPIVGSSIAAIGFALALVEWGIDKRLEEAPPEAGDSLA